MYAPIETLIIHAKAGDSISFDDPPETYTSNQPGAFTPETPATVVNTWWHRETNRFMIQLCWPSRESTIFVSEIGNFDKVTLYPRSSYSPHPRWPHSIGQRVTVDWMGRMEPGVVERAEHLPANVSSPTGESCYVVRMIHGTALVGAERLLADNSPAPAVGQKWVCLRGRSKGTVLTVVELFGDGLMALCLNERNGTTIKVLLQADYHGILVSTAPEPPGALGVDFFEDMITTRESGGVASRLVRIF